MPAHVEPAIHLEQLSALHEPSSASWRVEWRVKNVGQHSIRLLSVRLPHGQFKSEELGFEPALDLPPEGEGVFYNIVHCAEPPGEVTENAFVIFRAAWLDGSWRIFVRISVTMLRDRNLRTAMQSVTTQRVGFAEAI
jgi:hypothetical protein